MAKKNIFANRYAPLLLSSDTKAYAYVWPLTQFKRTIKGTLYVDWTSQVNRLHSICPNSKSQSEIGPPGMAVGQSKLPDSEVSAPLLNPPIEKNGEPADIDDEAPNHNEKPEHQWLVGRKRREFEESLEKFLIEKIPKHRRDWYRLVLTVGRREMRTGDQRTVFAHAIRTIEKELKEKFGTSAMPDASPNSTSTIESIVRGKYIEGMKEYFATTEAAK